MTTTKSRWISRGSCAALAFIVMLVFSVKGYAQESAAIDHMAKALTDSLGYLKLTKDQTQQVTNVHKTAVRSLVDLHMKAQGDTALKGSEMFKKMVSINRKKEAALMRIFTPDQIQKFKARKAERLADLQTSMMKSQLDLTDDQVKQVYGINMSSAPDMLHYFGEIQDKTGKEKSAAQRAFEDEIKDKDAMLKRVFSVQQYEMYQAYKADMRNILKDALN